ATLDTQKRFTATRIGIGVTNPAVRNPPEPYPDGLSVGTIGFYLSDAERRYYLVSNNHVLAGSDGTTLGSPSHVAAKPGDPVVHPGTLDFTTGELAGHPNLMSLAG